MSNTREFLEGIFSGQIPVTRRNPQTGAKENVYYNYDEDRDQLEKVSEKVDFNFDSINRLKKISGFLKGENSDRYRTSKLEVAQNWGKETEKKLNNYLKTKYNAPNYEQYNQWKKVLGTMDKVSSIIGVPVFYEKIYSSYVPFRDFDRNKNEMELSKIIGSDKFFHCKANYEAARRGKWESMIAEQLSKGREILQYLAHTDTLQGAADDMEANWRGRWGAQNGKSLEESCSRNPRDYYK